jgi:uncharacterized protein (TIGR02444 family)
LVIDMQDRYDLNVNLLLWCVWCGAFFEAADHLTMLNAIDRAKRWTTSVTQPLRSVRRALKPPPPATLPEGSSALREQVMAAELASERILQHELQQLAQGMLSPAALGGVEADRARKNLAAYVRSVDAARKNGFSVSLLERLVALTLPPAESSI